MSSSTREGPGGADWGVSWLGGFLGALVGFLAPGAAVLGAAVLTSSVGGEDITKGEWITAAVAALVASAAAEARSPRMVSREQRRAATEVAEDTGRQAHPEAGSSVR